MPKSISSICGTTRTMVSRRAAMKPAVCRARRRGLDSTTNSGNDSSRDAMKRAWPSPRSSRGPSTLRPSSTSFICAHVAWRTSTSSISFLLRPLSHRYGQLDVFDQLPYGAQLLDVLIGHIDREAILDRHHQRYGVERVCAQVADQTCVGDDVPRVHA